MKAPLLLLLLSLVADLGILGVFIARPALAPTELRAFLGKANVADSTDAVATAARAEANRQRIAKRDADRQGQVWSELQSPDTATLIARLRAAGFPPHLIRAIVGAQVETKFNSRMAELIGPMRETPFWKNDAFNSGMNTKFWEEYSQIYREKSKYTRELLGSDLYAPDGDEAAAKRRQFGDLTPAKVDLIQRINDDYAEMISQVRAATQGIMLPEDREKLALLESEKRKDLAAFLSPQELEDYEMRSSPVMLRLRGVLAVMDPTEDEVRALFRVQQKYNDRINPTGPGMVGADFMETRRLAQKQMFDEIKASLPPARFDEYVRAQNTEFQALNRIAQQENIAPEAALRAFGLRDKFAEESTKIFEDKTMNAEQKRTALQNLGQTARVQIIGTLGQNAGTAYAQTARWIGYMENGSAVSFGPDGQPTSRSLPRPAPTTK